MGNGFVKETLSISQEDILRLRAYLDPLVERFNQVDFIEKDPISIPHRFTQKQDIEIAGYFAATLAWGKRSIILAKCTDLLNRMDFEPYQFVLHANERDLKGLRGFVHRTFQEVDLLHILKWMQAWYKLNESLEEAFSMHLSPQCEHVGKGLSGFSQGIMNFDGAQSRTAKHLPNPSKGSACKRLNMYLRWMVRSDDKGVDFGLWNGIKPSQLLPPIDIHVYAQAGKLGLLPSGAPNWKTVIALWNNLKLLDPKDPIKYDFALFGSGVSSLSIEI